MRMILGKNKLKEQIKLFSDEKVGVVYGNMWILNEINIKVKNILENSTT